MDEFKFVMKCFLFACLLMMLSQVQTDGLTVESKVEVFLTHSAPAHFMQQAAAGGVKAAKEALVFTKAFVQEKMDHTSSKKSFQKDEDI